MDETESEYMDMGPLNYRSSTVPVILDANQQFLSVKTHLITLRLLTIAKKIVQC